MNKISFILFFIVIVFSFQQSSFSQENELYLLELKSGIQVKCYLKSITDTVINGIAEDGNEFSVNISEVKSFEVIKNDQKNNSSKLILQKKDHFSTALKLGVLSDPQNINFPLISFSAILNYEPNKFSFGIGVSADRITEDMVVPIYFDVKYKFSPVWGGVPYAYSDLGYNFSYGKGMMYGLGVGLKKKVSQSLDIVYELGFKSQTYNYNVYYNGNVLLRIPYTEHISYFTFNLGLQF